MEGDDRGLRGDVGSGGVMGAAELEEGDNGSGEVIGAGGGGMVGVEGGVKGGGRWKG